LIDCRGELPRLKKRALLKRPRLSIAAFGHIEDHGVGVELRRCVTIDRSSGVVLEFSGHEQSSTLCGVVSPDPGMGVMLQFPERNCHCLSMGHTHPIVPADQRGQRHRLGRGEGCVPTGAVFHAGDGLPVLILILVGGAMLDKLLTRRWMLPLAEPGKLLGSYASGEAESLGQPALPLPRDGLFLTPIVLLFGRELLGVVGLRLACRERTGDGQHGQRSEVHRYTSQLARKTRQLVRGQYPKNIIWIKEAAELPCRGGNSSPRKRGHSKAASQSIIEGQ
jgi:hypothetical protein